MEKPFELFSLLPHLLHCLLSVLIIVIFSNFKINYKINFGIGTKTSIKEIIGDFKKSVIEIINTANNSAMPLLPELSSAFSFTSPVILLKNQRLPKITIKAKMVTSKKKSKIYPTDVNIHIFPESRDK